MRRKVPGSYGHSRAALLAALVFLFASGCDEMRRHADLRWTEPVSLESGETVHIERHVEMWRERASGGAFSSAPFYKTSSLKLVGADNDFPLWNAPLVPLVLDRDPGSREWIVVAGTDGCSRWLRNGLPRPPYWAFRLRDGEWYRDAIPNAFLGRAANLYVEYDVVDSSDELEEQIRQRKKAQLTTPKHAPQYSRIDQGYGEFERCGRGRSSKPIGVDELDLVSFRRLQ